MNFWSLLKMMFQALVKPKRHILLPEIPKVRLLDIGGGGEGVIAQAGGPGVIAIDKYMSEISEACGKALDTTWMVADATALPHPNNSMDHATAFFSALYMSEEVQPMGITDDCTEKRVSSKTEKFNIMQACSEKTKNTSNQH